MKNSPVPTSQGDRNARFRSVWRLTGLLSSGLGDVGVDLLGRLVQRPLQVIVLPRLVGVPDVLQRELVGAPVGAGRRGVAVRFLGDLQEGLEVGVLVDLGRSQRGLGRRYVV